MHRALLTIPLVLPAVLAGCSDSGVLDETPIPQLALQLDSPVYGQFAGAGPLEVSGTLQPPEARLLVEGERVEVAPDGTFSVLLDADRAWRNVDIEAAAYGQEDIRRIPTFAGFDPVESFPGALSLRLTEPGLDALGALIGGLVDGFLTDDAVSGLLPGTGGDGFSLAFVGFSSAPTEVLLTPNGDALDLSFTLRDILLDLEVTITGQGEPFVIPVGLGIAEAGLGLPLGLRVNDTRTPVLVPGEPVVDLSVPTLQFGQADLSWLADLIGNNVDLGQLLTDAITQQAGGLGPIPLGGPIAFEQDLLGTPLALRLDDLRTDPFGIGIKLGIGLGTPIPDDLGAIPFPAGAGEPPPDLSVGLHDGLLAGLLNSDLLDLLEQDIQLPGPTGNLLGNILTSLPGGNQAPEANGWCLNLTPGEARLARFGRGEDSLVNIYLPDSVVTFAYVDPATSECTTWLKTSLALQIGVGLDGTALDLSIEAPEGRILEYGADNYDDPRNEQRVVEGLASRLSGLLSLLGGLGGDLLDLEGLLGGLGGGEGGLSLDGLNLSIRHQGPFLDASGAPVEGMSEVGIGLFAPPPE